MTKLKKLSTVGKVLSKVSNSSYSVELEGIIKHIAIVNMSKTAIKDIGRVGVSPIAAPSLSVDEHISVYSELDSDNKSILSDFSDIDDSEGLQSQQQVGGVLNIRPAVPGQSQDSKRITPKKTRTGRKY